MNSTDIFKHVSDLEAKCGALSAALDAKTKQSVDTTKFYTVPLTTEEVARFHGVADATVRDYAKRGLIELHPNSTDTKMLFRASAILTLDFTELRKEKSLLKR